MSKCRHQSMADGPGAYSEENSIIIFNRLRAFQKAKIDMTTAMKTASGKSGAPDENASLESKSLHLQSCLRTLLGTGLSLDADVVVQAGTALIIFLQSTLPKLPKELRAEHNGLRRAAERHINSSALIRGPDGKQAVSIRSIRGMHLFAIDAPTSVAADVQVVVWKLLSLATRSEKHHNNKCPAPEKRHYKLQRLSDHHTNQDDTGKTSACEGTGHPTAGDAPASSAEVRPALDPGAGIPDLNQSSSMVAPPTVSAAANVQPLPHGMHEGLPLKKRSSPSEAKAGYGQAFGGCPIAGSGTAPGNGGGGIQSTDGGAVGRTGQGLVASKRRAEAGTADDVCGASRALVDGTAAQAAASVPSSPAGQTPAATKSVEGQAGSSNRATWTRAKIERLARNWKAQASTTAATLGGFPAGRPRRLALPPGTEGAAAGQMAADAPRSISAKATTATEAAAAAAAAAGVGAGAPAANVSMNGAQGIKEFKVGEIVEYRWGSRGDWYRCAVTEVAGEGRSQKVEFEFLSRKKRKSKAVRFYSEVLKVADLEADGDVATPGTHLDDEHRNIAV